MSMYLTHAVKVTRDATLLDDPEDPEQPCEITETSEYKYNIAFKFYARYKTSGDKDWTYSDEIDGVGLDEDDKFYSCTTDEEATDDGVKGVVCKNLGSDDDIFSLYEQIGIDCKYSDMKVTCVYPQKLWEDTVNDFEEFFDTKFDDLQYIYYVCDIDKVDKGETTKAKCENGPKVEYTKHSGDKDKKCSAYSSFLNTAIFLLNLVI